MINLEIRNLISKENQKKFKGDENMDQELNDVMLNVAKEVNKKYEQIALEEAEQKGKKEGKKEIAKKLKEIHTPEEIVQITGLKIEEIRLL